MENRIVKYVFIAIGLLAVVPLMAGGPGAPAATPIDGGLSLLLAAGGAYGVRKIYQARKR